MSSLKSGDSIGELFEEAAGILDEPDTSNNATNASPKAGKTLTTNIAELATAVDGGSGYKCKEGIPSQGVHVPPPSFGRQWTEICESDLQDPAPSDLAVNALK